MMTSSRMRPSRVVPSFLWFLCCCFPTAIFGQQASIYQIVQSNPDFLALKTAMDIVVDGANTFFDDPDLDVTVFAPTNAAFNAVDGKWLEPNWSTYLAAILNYHVVPTSAISSQDMTLDTVLDTRLHNQEIRVTATEPLIVLNNASTVLVPNVRALNGMVHIVDQVLTPATASLTIWQLVEARDELSQLRDLLEGLELVDVLNTTTTSPMTLLAPTNDAFDAIPSLVWETLQVSSIETIVLNHVSTDLLVTSPSFTTTTDATGGGSGSTRQLLRGQQQRQRELTTTQQVQLPTLIPGISLKVTLEYPEDGTTTTVLLGDDGATITTPDILASNGVLHIVDTVLIPILTGGEDSDTTDAPPTKSTTTVAPTAEETESATTATQNAGTEAPTADATESMTDAPTVPATVAPTTQDNDTLPSTSTLWEQLVSTDQASDFVELWTLADASSVLQDPTTNEGYTVLVPSKQALDAFPRWILTGLGPFGLAQVLHYHVIMGQWTLDELTALPEGTILPTLQGNGLIWGSTETGQEVVIGDTTDQMASNGIWHIVDAVLIPVIVESENPEDDGTVAPTQLDTSEPPQVEATTAPTEETTTAAPTESDTEVTATEVATEAAATEAPTETELGATEAPTTEVNSTDAPPGLPSLAATVAANQDLSTLAMALNISGLLPALSEDGPFTVLAPVNNAFDEELFAATYLQPEWRAHLQALLLHHVLPGEVLSAELVEDDQYETLEGTNITVTDDREGRQEMDGVRLTAFDEVASNGVVHSIQDLLLPPALTQTLMDVAGSGMYNVSRTVQLIRESNLENVLAEGGPFTLFLPIDSAWEILPLDTLSFAAQIPDILTSHVVPGIWLAEDLAAGATLTKLDGSNMTAATVMNGAAENIIVNDTAIVDVADILASNGVIHVIDYALLPKEDPLWETSRSILDVVASDPSLSTFLGMLEESGLDFLLQGAGPFTLFAPDNDAIASIPSSFMDQFTENEMAQILRYHMVPGTYSSSALGGGAALTALQGSPLEVSVADDTNAILINDLGRVITPDLAASNGIVHKINALLIPVLINDKAPTILDLLSLEGNFTILATLLESSGLDVALEGDGPFTVFAPHNGAFELLPDGLMAGLDADGLASILQYHVLESELLADSLVELGAVETLLGEDIIITQDTDAGTVFLNGDTSVLDANNRARNGVIHVIDQVLNIPGGGDVAVPLPAVCAEGSPFQVLCCPVENAAFSTFCDGLGAR